MSKEQEFVAPNVATYQCSSLKPAWTAYRERGAVFAYRMLIRIWTVFGKKTAQLFLYPITLYFLISSRRTRIASSTYLECLYTWSEGKLPGNGRPNVLTVYRHLLTFAFLTFDKVAVWRGEITRQDLVWDNRDEYLALLNQEQGAVFVGAHFGNIEIGRALSDTETSRDAKINALVFKEVLAGFYRVLSSVNPKSNLQMVPLDRVTPDVVLRLRDKIAAGEYVATLADRPAAGAPDKVHEVEFLGKTARFPTGPWVLASMLECPVYLMFFVQNSDGRYRVIFEKFSDKLIFNRKYREKEVSLVVERYAKRLERMCADAPLQWFNFFDYWADSTVL